MPYEQCLLPTSAKAIPFKNIIDLTTTRPVFRREREGGRRPGGDDRSRLGEAPGVGLDEGRGGTLNWTFGPKGLSGKMMGRPSPEKEDWKACSRGLPVLRTAQLELHWNSSGKCVIATGVTGLIVSIDWQHCLVMSLVTQPRVSRANS